MKHVLVKVALVASTFAVALSADQQSSSPSSSCPCFTAAQYDDLLAAFPPSQHGCRFVGTPDVETHGLATVYLYHDETHSPITVVQAAVTVEQIHGSFVEGGICGVGGELPAGLTILNQNVQDYGQGYMHPHAFQDCVDIMQSRCQAMCTHDLMVHDDDDDDSLLGLSGCGKLPFALHQTSMKDEGPLVSYAIYSCPTYNC